MKRDAVNGFIKGGKMRKSKILIFTLLFAFVGLLGIIITSRVGFKKKSLIEKGDLVYAKFVRVKENEQVKSNDKLELSGLTLKMNGEIVEEGFICNPSVMFETGIEI